jgi:hypothetical protein
VHRRSVRFRASTQAEKIQRNGATGAVVMHAMTSVHVNRTRKSKRM